MTSLAQQFQAHADYQPDALAVDAGRRLIVDALSPILGTEHIPLRDALGRVLADSVTVTASVGVAETWNCRS